MAAKPLTTEAIALTEKKMDMTLDDIIKMSKKPSNKEKNAPRRSIKAQGFLSGIASQRNNKLQRFMDSRASIRQGVLAQRRSNFRGNQFPLATNAARRAAVMPIRNVAINWNAPRLASATTRATAQRRAADGVSVGKDTMVMPTKQRPQTLDALFANMKVNRMKVMSSQQQAMHNDGRQAAQRRRARQQQQQQQRGARGGAFPGRRQVNF